MATPASAVSRLRMLALGLAPAIWVAAGAAVVLFVASSGLGATLDAAAGDLAPPERRAQVMSAYADWSDLGAAFGPLLALTLADSIGLRPSYTFGAVLLALGAAAMLIAFRHHLKDHGVLASERVERAAYEHGAERE